MSSIGLGCSKFGSFGGTDSLSARTLISLALDNGITHFDTAACYGQGDSERILGNYLPHSPDLFLVTKVGKVTPLKARLLKPIKGLVRLVGKNSQTAKAAISSNRPRSLPTCFNNKYLANQLRESLKNLKRDHIPLVMLHSPPESVLLQGDAIAFLSSAREKGVLGMIGVSVDTIEEARASLQDSRVDLIQVPFGKDDTEFADWTASAVQSGRQVIAREIMRLRPSIAHITHGVRPSFEENLRRCLESENVLSTLIGTTSASHLQEAIDIWKGRAQ